MAVFSSIAAAIGVSTSTALAGLGAVATAAGAVASYAGQQQAAGAQKKALAAQEQQANLEQSRQRRQVFRDMLKAQAMTEVAGAGSGAMGSSAVAGGLATASNSFLQSTRDLNQNSELGAASFAAQRSAVGAGNMGSLLGNIGSGLSSLSNSSFIRNLPPMTRMGK